MRGDKLHQMLLAQGWRWDRAEEYVKDFDGFSLRFTPAVPTFPAQRAGAWLVRVAPTEGQERTIMDVEQFTDLKMFVR